MIKEIKNRDDAFQLLSEYVKEEYLINHCLATEAIMRKMAERFGEDPDKWGIAGLLHDLDFEETKDNPCTHTLKTEEILRPLGISEDMISAIKAHNAEEVGVERKTVFDYSLTCAESVTGLITATALMQPDKQLSSVKPESVLKKMKKKEFARKVSRERIKDCAGAGLELEDFINLSVNAMIEAHIKI